MRRPAYLSSVPSLVFAYTMLLQDLLRDLRSTLAPAPGPEVRDRLSRGRDGANVIAGPWITRFEDTIPHERLTTWPPAEALLYE